VGFARLDWGHIMRGVVKVVVIHLLALVAGGLVLSAVAKARMAAQGAECHNNLRALGLAVLNYHDAYGRKFPTGTAPNAALPPERRLTWVTEVYPAYMVGGEVSLLDGAKPWDDGANNPPRCRLRMDPTTGRWREGLVGEVKWLLGPANPARNGPSPDNARRGFALPRSPEKSGFGNLGNPKSARALSGLACPAPRTTWASPVSERVPPNCRRPTPGPASSATTAA
jgi:hypothetical protein